MLALRVSTLQRRWEPLTLLLRGRSCEPERRPRLEWPWPLDGRADPKDRYQLLRVLFAGSVAGTGRRAALTCCAHKPAGEATVGWKPEQ